MDSRRLWLCIPLALAFGSAARAADNDFPTFHASWENDTRTISRSAMPSDRFYTNGARASLTWAPSDKVSATHGLAHYVLRLMPFVSDEVSENAQANGYGYAIGQNMYSPSRIDQPVPDPSDRPYGGWLYFGVLGTHVRYQGAGDIVKGRVLRRYTKEARTVELDVGAIGPASGSAEAQRWVHAHLCNCTRPAGWGSQIHNEPGVHASYDWAWRHAQLYRITHQGKRAYEQERLFDLSTSLGASAGNVFTNGRVGGVARAGWNLSDDLAPDANIRSFAGDVSKPLFPVSAYAYARGEGRAVMRNVFLDGNLFRTSRRVLARQMVADWEYGFVVDLFAVRASWRRVMRSPEFVGQESPQVYGVVNLSLNFVQTGRSLRDAFSRSGR